MINTSSTTSIQNRQWLDDYHSGPSADSSAPDALPIQSDWSSWQPIFKSRKSHITLDLGLTLYGFARPDDSWNVVAHEMVHSLDAYGNDNKDGLPVFSTEQDQQIFIRERERGVVCRLFQHLADATFHQKYGIRIYQ